MTKHRPPLSFDAALARIVGQLPGGYAEAAERTDRSISLVRAWGDPDRREKISIDDAIALDLAFQQTGGIGAPFFEAYGAQLGVAGADRFSQPQSIHRLLGDVMRETNDAELAMLRAAMPDATDGDRRNTAKEVREAIAVLTRALHLVEPSHVGDRHQTGPPDQV